jgi:hypothetical protein
VANGVLTDVNGDGNLTWVVPTSSTFTGGTVSGATNFTGGLTANTIFATNYLNLPTDIRTTGATYSNNTFTFTNNGTGGTFNVLFNTVTGLTVNGNLTVTGNTSLQGVTGTTILANGNLTVTGNTSLKGVTATTISATTYQNLPSFLPLSGGTITGNVIVNGTGQRAITALASNSGTSQGIFSYATNGTNAYGVYGVSSPGEFDTITNGIGGYFASDNSQGYANPTNRYSVQLVDGTEGINKVLTSVTSDGKANWSNVLTGLTNVRSTTISATTYQNLPTSISAGTTFVSGLTANTFTISTIPTLNYTSSQVLTRNTTSGNVEYIPINQVKTNGTNLYLFYNY